MSTHGQGQRRFLGPKNSSALYVIKGEISLLLACLRKNTRWTSHQQEGKSDPIFRKLQALKESLDHVSIKEGCLKISSDANFFLLPFLDVIRSEEITGPITALALSSVEKFICYEIVNENNGSSGAVEAISDAVIHAHFVSGDSASDEIVLMKILQVLYRLFVNPIGSLLSNESVCELMQSCFRVCFIERANDLLKKSAESALTDMIRLLFSRIHSFSTTSIASLDKDLSKKSTLGPKGHQHHHHHILKTTPTQSQTPNQPKDSNVIDGEAKDNQQQQIPDEIEGGGAIGSKENIPEIHVEGPSPPKALNQIEEETSIEIPLPGGSGEEFKTRRGVKFTANAVEEISTSTPTQGNNNSTSSTTNTTKIVTTNSSRITVPYGIPCVRELFRFLISLINPHEKQNTELMIHLGLKLLLVAIEAGIDSISRHQSLMNQARNELCKNLIALLNSQNTMPVLSSKENSSSSTALLINVLRILFLLFESNRISLKYQLEVFILRISELLSESITSAKSWSYEQREIALDFLVQLWKLPCLVTELYLNYDCDLFSSNLFEDTTKLLSKNAFPMQAAPLQASTTIINSFHLLCLEGLLSILDGIEGHCTTRIVSTNNTTGTSTSDDSNASSVFYHDSSIEEQQNYDEDSSDSDGKKKKDNKPSHDITLSPENQGRKGFINIGTGNKGVEEALLPTHEQLMAVRHKKKIFHTGSEQFNISQSKGIEFLKTHGLLSTPIDPNEIAIFLKENPLLDKKAIGEYVSNKKNTDILKGFVQSFEFAQVRIDEALRLFLETFRLPGEAPLISHIMEAFAEIWTNANEGRFANADAAFTLSYAIIMLNVDQHNANVRKQGNVMTLEEFRKNVKGVNGGNDFDQEMLKEIYVAIKSDEIVMPAEQTGVVRDNYVWKVLLKRGASPLCKFLTPAVDEGVFDHDLFSLSWGPIIAALSFLFDKAPQNDTAIISKTLGGFRKCATISAHYGMSDVFDNLIISLCKFTTLLGSTPNSDPISSNPKSIAAIKAVFQLLHRHGDILREGWHNFIDTLIALFKLQLLPKILTESEDFTDPSGRISIVRRSTLTPSTPRVEAGIFSSLYSYISLSADSPGSKTSLADEEENRNKSLNLIAEVRPELLLSESKFLQLDSLQELIKSLIYASPVPETPKRKDYDEDAVVFVLEVLLKICIHNRDRALAFWDVVRDHLFNIIIAVSQIDMPFLLERATVGLLRVALRLMRKEDLCPVVLQSLRILLYLRPATIMQLSQQLSFGLHEILKTTAANIHMAEEWSVIFSLLEYIGAGKVPGVLHSLYNQNQSPSSQNPIQNPQIQEIHAHAHSDSETNKKSISLLSNETTTLYSNTSSSLNRGHSISSSGLSSTTTIKGVNQPFGYSSGSDRGYTSDSELEIIKSYSGTDNKGGVSPAQSWILLSQDDQQLASPSSPQLQVQQNQTGTSLLISPQRPQFLQTQLSAPAAAAAIQLHQQHQQTAAAPNQQHQQSQQSERQLFYPDPKSLLKSCETLSFLVRDAAHITPDNFTLCVGSIRSFVEASTLKTRTQSGGKEIIGGSGGKKKRHPKRGHPGQGQQQQIPPRSKSFSNAQQVQAYDADESDSEDQSILASSQVCIQLLDLLHTLHTRAASIFQWWEKEAGNILENSLWALGWRPLLQAIVILCSDSRRSVRTTALTYLQRALLVHDLQQLTPQEWYSCFNEVLFPLMSRLLEPISPLDPTGMEETRMRAATLLCKVFLQHLTPLLQLESFTPLWLQILDFLERYMKHSERSELLVEAIPESLKNLLLVMETAGVFHTPDGYTKLWAQTWEKIDGFLPALRAELLRAVPPQQQQQQQQQQPAVTTSALNIPTTTGGGELSKDQVISQVIANEGLSLEQSRFDEPSNILFKIPPTTPNAAIYPTITGGSGSQCETPLSQSPGKSDYTSIVFDEDENNQINSQNIIINPNPTTTITSTNCTTTTDSKSDSNPI